MRHLKLLRLASSAGEQLPGGVHRTDANSAAQSGAARALPGARSSGWMLDNRRSLGCHEPGRPDRRAAPGQLLTSTWPRHGDHLDSPASLGGLDIAMVFVTSLASTTISTRSPFIQW